MNAETADPKPNSPKTAVLLIAHGSRNPAANQDLFDLATRLAAAGDHPIIEASFLELAEPDILEGGRRCVERGAGRVLMAPYFLSMGVHLVRDLADAREELSRTYPNIVFELGRPLGPDPLLDELVKNRVRELAEVGSLRADQLAQIPAKPL